VAIGDSQISGLVGTSSYADATTGYPDSPVDSMPGYLGRALGLTYQNMGIGGQTTNQIALRFAADVLAAAPRLCLIEGGVNDIFYGTGSGAAIQASVLSNATAMLTSCQAAGILPVLCLIGPMATYGLATSGGIALRHSINVALQALGATFNAIVVDWSPAIGQPTTLDASGDYSQLQAQYDSGDHLHPNSAGYARVAQVVAEALASLVLSGRGTFGGLLSRGNLAFEGSEFRRIELDRNPTYESGGQALVLRAGAAFLEGSNLGGGQLVLSSGISTGSGYSSISFQTAPGSSAGNLDNLPTQCALLQQNGSFTQLALTGQASSQVDFWSGGSYQCACGFDAPTGKFAIYGSASASAPVLTVDASGNLFTHAATLQAGLTITAGGATILTGGLTVGAGGAAITGTLNLLGPQTTSSYGIFGATSIPASGAAGLCVVAPGSSWLHASGCIANFYGNTGSSYCGVWLGYNVSNNCGLIGANVAGISNNNLSVCSDGGTLLIGATSVPGTGSTGLCLVASGSGWIHASSCIANFYASSGGSFRGVWLGYDASNSCGIIGANTQGASNDNLSLCSDGGNVIIGGRQSITSGYMLQIGNGSLGALWVNGPAIFAASVKFAGTNTTGSGIASLGSNCPAGIATAPYTWIQALASDGSIVYLPAWR
jgi:lysophospholipase L1-like esterase